MAARPGHNATANVRCRKSTSFSARARSGDKDAYRAEWRAHKGEGINPALFFDALRRQLPDSAIVTVDDGNHTFLAAELFEVRQPRTFLSPTDFNCMGYAIAAAIGAQFANPERRVVSIVGDGALLMTGLEIVTAATHRLPIVFFVFDDGEIEPNLTRPGDTLQP